MSFSLLPFLEKHLSHDEPFILGCSTGADSMYLLYKILETPYKKNLIAAYFNHHTRDQCQQEEAFLQELGKKEGFQVEIWECDFEKIKKLYPSRSFEELAREKRYQFFDALCHIHEAKKVFLGHHLDDRIETLLFNMLRGTKLTGLINMQEVSGNIFRPLLRIEKSEILEYLKQCTLPYFEDESNTKNEYTRNFIRNEISPLLQRVHPEYKKNISNLFGYFEELKQDLEKQVLCFLEDGELISWEKGCFPFESFFLLSPFIQNEVIRYIYFLRNNRSTIGLSEWNIAEIIRFFHGKSEKWIKKIHSLNMKKEKGLIHF